MEGKLTPRWYQEECIKGMWNFLENERGNGLVIMQTGCHGKGSLLVMYDGTRRKVENIRVGDLLMGDDGTPRQVLRLARGREELCEVHAKHCEPRIYNISHKLPVVFNHVKGIATLAECERAEPFSCSLTREMISTDAFKHSHTPLTVRPQRFGELLGRKAESIPARYLLNNYANRFKLLKGIVKSCGYALGGHIVLKLSSFSLRDDVKFLADSLGYLGTKEEPVVNVNSCFLTLRGYLDQLADALPSKTCKPVVLAISNVSQLPFTVKRIGEGDFYGFSLSGNKLYLEDTCVVSHNTGKSLVPAEFIRRVHEKWPNQRFIVATHVEELVAGNYRAYRKQEPFGDGGICHAGLKQYSTQNNVVYGGIGTMVNRVQELGHRDILFVDEAHMIGDKASTMYLRFISELLEINPYLRVLGLTATPYRLGMGHLLDGGLFSGIAYDLCTRENWARLIKEKFLAPLVTKRTKFQFDVEHVGKARGDYKIGELEAAVNIDSLTEQAIKELVERGQERKHWLVFTASVDHANSVRDGIRRLGYAADSLHGVASKMEPGLTRGMLYKRFEESEIRALVTVGMTTTGYDFPGLDLIAHFRPTDSPSLHVQMNGRGTRPDFANGKEDCLVLDFVGNTLRLGPIDEPKVPKKKGEGDGTTPVKVCPMCDTIVHAATAICPVCLFEFPREDHLYIGPASDETVMLASGEEPTQLVIKPKVVEHFVSAVTYTRHKGKGNRPDSVKVSYNCGRFVFTEFLCFEHQPPMNSIAIGWWRKRHMDVVPYTVNDALVFSTNLPTPAYLKVDMQGKFPVIKHSFIAGEWIPH